MLEYFPERRKSSTDLLPLPKVSMFRRSPSPAKRSFSDLLTPFQKKSNDDSLYFLDKQEPFAKKPAKLFSISKNKALNKISIDLLNDFANDFPIESDESDNLLQYTFIDNLSTDVPEAILQKQQPNLSYEDQCKIEKSFVLWELVTSEIVYLKQLWFLVKLPMKILNRLHDQFFNKLDTNTIFNNLIEVLSCNVQFWSEFLEPVYEVLQLSGRSPCLRHLMMDGFGNLNKHFIHYKPYCMNISSSCEYITRQENESDNFKIFMEWCRNSNSSNRLGLDSFITMPFQRITRYTLFLERILKVTNCDDDCQLLIQAIMEVEKFVNAINRKVKVKELISKLVFFEKIIIGLPNAEEYRKKGYPIPPYPAFSLTCPMQVKEEFENEIRCLIYQETFRMKKLHQKTILVKLLLFTDLLLIVKPLKKNQQCKLQLINGPLSLNQVILLDNSHTASINIESSSSSILYWWN